MSLRIEDFSATLMLKILYIVSENLVFDKREVYRPTFITGLSAKLYGRVISKLPSYWVASSYWDAIVTVYLIVKYGLQAWVLGLRPKHTFAF